MIAPYAWKEALVIVVGGAVLCAAGAWLAWWLGCAVALLAAALLAFYRDPPRRIPADPNLLVAPADGRVLRVSEEDTDTGRAVRVVIFLSVLNVHVNRMPCAATVGALEYRAGRYRNALRAAATAENERNTLTLEPEGAFPGPVIVRQIAGMLARRIVCGVREGQRLPAGARLGMIKLGSQTELRVPPDPRWRVLVARGDRVKGGVTGLLRYECE